MKALLFTTIALLIGGELFSQEYGITKIEPIELNRCTIGGNNECRDFYKITANIQHIGTRTFSFIHTRQPEESPDNRTFEVEMELINRAIENNYLIEVIKGSWISWNSWDRIIIRMVSYNTTVLSKIMEKDYPSFLFETTTKREGLGLCYFITYEQSNGEFDKEGSISMTNMAFDMERWIRTNQ